MYVSICSVTLIVDFPIGGYGVWEETVVASAIVSLTLTPMMCSRLLRPRKSEPRGRIYRASERFFDALSTLSFNFPSRAEFFRTAQDARWHGVKRCC